MISKSIAKITNRAEIHRLEEICSRVISLCNSNSLKDGICIHAPIIKLDLHEHLYINNNLLSLYAKCIGLESACQFFDEMPQRDVVSWTSMSSAFVKAKNYEQALELFKSMMISGDLPNEFTLSSVLRSCSGLGKFNYGSCIQGYVIKLGFESNPVLGSALVDLYSKWGFTDEGFKLFKQMENGDTVSWTTMVSSFVEAGRWGKALKLYVDMIEAGVEPNEFTFAKLLAACSFLGLNYGKLVHGQMIVWGVKMNVVLKTALVDMFSRLNRMEDAIKVLDSTSDCDELLWTAIISGFNHNMKFKEAIAAFHDMGISGISPNNYTYSSVLNACASMQSLELGKQIHSQAVMAGFEDDVSVGNALIHMYMKCSDKIEDGLKLFRGINSPNVVSWTSLIAGCVEHGFEREAFRILTEMMATGLKPNSFTLSTILRAYNSRVEEPLYEILKLHGYVIKTKADYDIVVGNALMDAYARIGMVDNAWHVITMMGHRDVTTYTSFATRMNQMGQHEMALNVVTHMYEDDIKIDEFCLASLISATTESGKLETGKQLHCHSAKSSLSSWISVSNSLVMLYGKSGCLGDMHRSFREITKPDVFSWNGLISGFASNGYISSALSSFDNMRLSRVKPDSFTLLLILFTCSHGGLVDLGIDYFECMTKEYDIPPQLNHYVCLVDLLGRAGRLEEAIGVIETMPFEADAKIYKTLLGACKIHKNVPLAEDMARRGLEIEPLNKTFYVMLADLYDNTGRSDLAEKTCQMMRDRGLKNIIRRSSLEFENEVPLFVVGHKNWSPFEEIF